uniref:Serine carboxypeptidase-like 18 n=1 Tax=Zea mays TaxID=4577 RepID=C0HEH5_MAIZE|nr:unknown [Zea mays]
MDQGEQHHICGLAGGDWVLVRQVRGRARDRRHQASEAASHFPQEDHPRFVMNPLYIAGDSYSGLIIPTLALEIDRSIELGEKIFSGLKGYIAGNPLTGGQFDTDSQIPYFHAMGLVSDELYKNARENCGGKYSAPLNAVCAEAVQAINNCTRDINKQYILDPACPDDDLLSPKTVAETDGTSRLMLESADFLLGSKCAAKFQRSYPLTNSIPLSLHCQVLDCLSDLHFPLAAGSFIHSILRLGE